MKLNPTFKNCLVLIKGAGDLASGVAFRLKRAGFPLIMTELPEPVMVRRTVSFGDVVYGHEMTIEEVSARLVDSLDEALALAYDTTIPVMIDPQASMVGRARPTVVVDAIMAKVNTGTTINDARRVIALGPGFTAPQDCHAVIETNRGHWLGRVISVGSAEPNTSKPGAVKGHTADRVLRAPAAGQVHPAARIGDSLQAGQLIGTIGQVEVRAPFAGMLRGLVHPRVVVKPGFKIGDLDPRADRRHCFTISDKSLAIGGGVLEAILASDVVRPRED
ncbi:MAG: selenium-dependent molybdenum cofactor biosynthesis protein YqeB [Anaerolineae bacterium]|nr:selenium-dependent molybdenum cofactor biosynthesis protein YqeB [Anaerolineae bacterium]